MQATAIQVTNLFKLYGPDVELGLARVKAGASYEEMARDGYVVALNNINLSVQTGKICVVMGLSGSGKSTLLRCLNRLIAPSAGEVRIEGTDITKVGEKEVRAIRASKIGMVFQHFALLPHMSVLDNVALGLRVLRVAKKERRERAAKALHLVGLADWGNRKPRDLSGGMRQRVGLARALVMDSPVLLMDEPFSALDPLIREEMQQELLRLQASLNKSIVFVTHDPNEAITLGDHVAILLRGEMVQQGPPLDVVLSPATDYVKNFVRGVSVFKVLRAAQAIDRAHPSIDLSKQNVEPLTHGRYYGDHLVPVLGPKGRVVGVLDRHSLPARLPAGSPVEWRQFLSQEYLSISPDTLVAPLVEELSRGRRALVVCAEDGRFVGMVTGRSILQALSTDPALGGVSPTDPGPNSEVAPAAGVSTAKVTAHR